MRRIEAMRRIEKIISDIAELQKVSDRSVPMLDLGQILGFMPDLASRRPIFHSEADFKHELAWQLHDEGYEVRLEYPSFLDKSGDRKALDIWFPKERLAIELKYPTRGLKCKDLEGEYFELSDHGGQPLRRYDFFKDIHRLEQAITLGQEAKNGLAILLTNDSALWTPPDEDDIVDACFRLHDREIKGPITLEWGPGNPSAGTIKSRESPIFLMNSYSLNWQSYPNQDCLALDKDESNSYKEFRYLAVEIKGS